VPAPKALPERIEEVHPRALLYVDRAGNVRRPTALARARAQLLANGTWWAPLAGGLAYFGLGSAGLPLLVAGFVGGVVMKLRTDVWRQLNVAAWLRAQGNLERARMTATTARDSGVASRRQRSFAERLLANIAAVDGRHADQLAHAAAARKLGRPTDRPALWALLAAEETIALVNLGRVAEARARLAEVHSSDGDLVRLVGWVAELYVCHAEGKHTLLPAELEERVRGAMPVPTAAALLALCAWGYERLGDVARAQELLREAFKRSAEAYFDRKLPRLHAWMTERATWATPNARL
jgi:hypothetical protein